MFLFMFWLFQKKSSPIQRHRPVSSDYKSNYALFKDGLDSWINVNALLGQQNCLSGIGSIYTTKIDVVVCPPNISETVAGRLIKLAHRQCIPRQR